MAARLEIYGSGARFQRVAVIGGAMNRRCSPLPKWLRLLIVESIYRQRSQPSAQRKLSTPPKSINRILEWAICGPNREIRSINCACGGKSVDSEIGILPMLIAGLRSSKNDRNKTSASDVQEGLVKAADRRSWPNPQDVAIIPLAGLLPIMAMSARF